MSFRNLRSMAILPALALALCWLAGCASSYNSKMNSENLPMSPEAQSQIFKRVMADPKPPLQDDASESGTGNGKEATAPDADEWKISGDPPGLISRLELPRELPGAQASLEDSR